MQLFRLSVILLSLAVLLLSQYCVAVGEKSGAATPGVQEAGEPSAPTLQEFLDSTSPFTQWRRMPMAYEYINYLNFERVSRLLSTFARDQDAHVDPHLPFYGRIPLFSVGTPPPVVEQALRDYGTVGIVDSLRGEAMQIYRDEGHLSQQTFPDLHKVLTVFRLPGKVHEVRKAIFGQSFRPIAMDTIDEVPHARGLPILLPNHDSVAHMIAASNQDRRAFLLPQPRNTFMAINPRTDDLASFPSAENTAEIIRVRNGYHSDTQIYGRALASLKWGRPLDRIPELTHFRSTPPSLAEYPRFKSSTATRDQIITALHDHGRFRLYLDQPGQPNMAYRVKLTLVRPPGGSPRRELRIEALTRGERLAEKAMSLMKKVRLPS